LSLTPAPSLVGWPCDSLTTWRMPPVWSSMIWPSQ
jgi:hypothetical protein